MGGLGPNPEILPTIVCVERWPRASPESPMVTGHNRDGRVSSAQSYGHSCSVLRAVSRNVHLRRESVSPEHSNEGGTHARS